MPAISPHTTNLRLYVNDMVALEKEILTALEKQKEDERVKSDAKISDLLERIHTTTRAHLLSMENHAAAVGGEAGVVKDAVATMAGTLVGLYEMVRKHPLSRMLRDDYTALSLAATSYSMLYTTGLALRDLPVANVALRHLNETTPLIMELSQVIPAVVVAELALDDPNIDLSIVNLATEKTLAAWTASKQIGA